MELLDSMTLDGIEDKGLSEEFVESQYNSSISKQIEETNLFTYE